MNLFRQDRRDGLGGYWTSSKCFARSNVRKLTRSSSQARRPVNHVPSSRRAMVLWGIRPPDPPDPPEMAEMAEMLKLRHFELQGLST